MGGVRRTGRRVGESDGEKERGGSVAWGGGCRTGGFLTMVDKGCERAAAPRSFHRSTLDRDADRPAGGPQPLSDVEPKMGFDVIHKGRRHPDIRGDQTPLSDSLGHFADYRADSAR